MRRQSYSGLAARSFFDAARFHGNPHLGVPDQLADYTAVRGVVRLTVDGPPVGGTAVVYVFGWTPSVVRSFKITHALESGGGAYQCEFPFKAHHAKAAGPSMIRPLRQSLVMRNTSAAQDVQGFIRVLHLNQPITLEYTNVTDQVQKFARTSFLPDKKEALLSFINQHPRTRTITNQELRGGVSIPILPGTMSQYKEYHEWVDLNPNQEIYENGSVNGMWSNEQELSYLLNRYITLNPMSTLLIEVPTLVGGQAMGFDMVYHYQDAVRAADPESITAQFARPGRPMPSHVFNNVMYSAQRNDDVVVSAVTDVSDLSGQFHGLTGLVQERPSIEGEPQATRPRLEYLPMTPTSSQRPWDTGYL